MGSDRRNDKRDEVHKTVPVFGVSATEESLDKTDGPSEEWTVTRSPVPISSPLSESGAELPGVIEPGVVLLKKYRVLKEIGRGGMGAVWLVEHIDLGEKRALKVIHAIVAADPGVRDRFKREAQILAKLRHPNAVRVHDTGVVGQVPFIDMDYLEGQTLRELLKPGKPIPIATMAPEMSVMWLLKEVCAVLDRAHALGIVHRDLKPENIMIIRDPLSGKPELKVLDFGIAKIVQVEDDGGPGLTLNTEGVLGTPAYCSPEQNDYEPETNHRRAIDRRSDIYSLGVILFEMLTGSRPFKGSYVQLLYQHAKVEPPHFKEVAPELDIAPALEAVVRRCLEKSPDNRPQSAHELYDQFSQAIQVIDTPPPPPVPPPVPWPGWLARLWPAWLTRRRAAVLGLLLLVSPLVWFKWPHPTPTPTPNSIPPEVMGRLAKAGFRPGPATEIAEDGWPAVIARSEGEPRTMIRHGRVYLPQGYEPESEGTDEGLPRVVKSQYGIRFILIKGDSFMMGALNNGIAFTDEERPSHHVILSTFYMQETETAIGEFDRFCKETGRRPNDPDLETFHEVRNSLLKDMSEEACRKRPASGVSRKLAELYAHSVGGELPSEAQWEFAARSGGQSLSLYVWGNEDDAASPRTRKVNLDNNLTGKISTWDVGTSTGDRTKQGIQDLAGNVREWCRDVWKVYSDTGTFLDPVQRFTDGQGDPKYVIRGGAYDTPLEAARVTYRSDLPNLEYRARDDDAFLDVGLRVVLEVFVTEHLTSAGKSGPGKPQESSR